VELLTTPLQPQHYYLEMDLILNLLLVSWGASVLNNFSLTLGGCFSNVGSLFLISLRFPIILLIACVIFGEIIRCLPSCLPLHKWPSLRTP